MVKQLLRGIQGNHCIAYTALHSSNRLDDGAAYVRCQTVGAGFSSLDIGPGPLAEQTVGIPSRSRG